MFIYFKKLVAKMHPHRVLGRPEDVEPKNPEQILMETEASHLIAIGSWGFLFELVSHGYEITESQKRTIKERVSHYSTVKHDSKTDQENSKKLEALLLCGYELDTQEVAKLMSNTTFLIYCGKELAGGKTYSNSTTRKDMPYWAEASKQILKAVDRQEVIEELYNNWIKLAKTYQISVFNSGYELIYPWNIMKARWIERMSEEDYKSVMLNLSRVNPENNGNADKKSALKESIETCYREHNSMTPKDLIERAKKLYAAKNPNSLDDKMNGFRQKNLSLNSSSEPTGLDKAISLSKSIRASNEQLSEEIKTNKLGAKADSLVEKIIVVINSMAQKSFNPEDAFTLRNISDKVLPETVHKYLSIDEDYRVEMRNKDGKNAYDLLCEALENIEAKLLEMKSASNENHFNQMGAQVIYTKKLQHGK